VFADVLRKYLQPSDRRAGSSLLQRPATPANGGSPVPAAAAAAAAASPQGKKVN
jgi:hypothetical protein